MAGHTLNAAEAARLAGVSERTMREWLNAGKIAGAQKQGTPGGPARRPGQPAAWEIDPASVPALQRVPPAAIADAELAGRVAALEQEVRRLRGLLEAFAGARTLPATAKPSESPLMRPQGHSRSPVLYENASAFRTYTDGARWIEQHGVPANTARQWVSWRGVVPLERSALLRDALSRYDPNNWRLTWRLHQCTVADCPCRELLPA